MRVIIIKQVIMVLVGLVAGASVLAQQGSEESPNPCKVDPIFHCAKPMSDGSYIAHFGYRTSCPENEKPIEEKFIPIGDENFFSPEPIDRGQPKVFLSGYHVDEFEVQFSAAEIEEGKELAGLL